MARALACAQGYWSLGYVPLPSKSTQKRPDLPEYASAHEGATFESWLSPEFWRSPNIQLVMGHRAGGTNKLIVVDCDGDRAKDVWADMLAANEDDDGGCWVVDTGGGGLHTYYAVDPGVAVPTGMIWGLWDTWGCHGRAGWAKHEEVKILGDGNLVVAPPSIHCDTGVRYAFRVGASPRVFAAPKRAPPWLLAMDRLRSPDFKSTAAAKSPELLAVPKRNGSKFLRSEEVLALVHDKISVAAGWGLRFAVERPNARGWLPCLADATDKTPSGSFHAATGVFKDFRTNEAISFFTLGVRLGRFLEWTDAKAWCESEFSEKPNHRSFER